MFKELWNKLKGKTPTTIGFQQSYDLTGLPIVTLYQGDKKYNFILDTGATNNSIHKDLIKELECKKLDIQTNMYGIEGTQQPVDAYAINFTYKNEEFPYFYLTPDLSNMIQSFKNEFGVTVHGLLGSGFFNQYKYVLDFNEMIAYSKR